MKKLIMVLMVCILIFSTAFATGIVYEKPDIAIVVDGTEIATTDVPIIVNSRTLIPLRTLLVALGVPDNDENIQWIGEQRRVKVYHEDISIQLDIDSDIAYINGQMHKLDSPAIIHNSRTYLPAKFVGEALGYGVFWDASHPAVVVAKTERYEFNKEILDLMNNAFSNISNYDATVTAETLIMVSGSNYEEYNEKFMIEKVDVHNRLMEVMAIYSEDMTNGVREYYSDSAKYYNRDATNNFPTSGWQVSKYNSSMDSKTPFEGKRKIIDLQLKDSLYAMLECMDLGENYCFYNVTNNADLLKCFADVGLYSETIDGNSKIKDLRISIFLEKNFLLPIRVDIEVEREITGNEAYGLDKVIVENTSWRSTINYDQDMSIVLPR